MGTKKLTRGFTLMEIIVSIVLISIAAAGFASAFSYHRRVGLLMQHKTQALDFAKATMDELMLKDYADAVLTASATEYTYVAGSGTEFLQLPACSLKDTFGAARSYKVDALDLNGDAVNDAKRIRVLVTWTEAGEPVSSEQRLYFLIIEQ